MKLMKFFLIASIICVVSLLYFNACSSQEQDPQSATKKPTLITPSAIDLEENSTQIYAMNTAMDLMIYGPNGEKGLAAATERITKLEAMLSVTDKNSEVYAINHSNGERVTLSKTTTYIIGKALHFSEMTDGAVDITIYPIVRAWGFTTDKYKKPSEKTIAKLLPLVDYKAVDFNSKASTITLPKDVQIDLGSIAKGYTGDLLAEVLRVNKVKSAILNLGGNVQAIGSKPDGSPWRVAIKHPKEDTYLGVVEVHNKAVITSGGYERYFLGNDGQVYWHIMDPATGKPANSGLISATIIADEGIKGDALSTAFFVMGLDKAISYWQKNGDFDFVLVTQDKEVYISEGIAETFVFYADYEHYPLTVVKKNEK